MSPSEFDDRSGNIPSAEAPHSGSSTSSLVRDLTAHVTVIIGHAQLLRRRTRHLTGRDAAALDRSLSAIEDAARRAHDTLRTIGTPAESDYSREDGDR